MARRTIAGTRAIVTGASGGIGRQIALELGRHGGDVLAVARRDEALRELANEFEPLPGRFEYLAGDITDTELRHECIRHAEKVFGGLDLLINNAGVGALGPFKKADPERLRQIMEVNFFAAAEMIRLALPLLKKGRNPMIVNMGSILGHRGIPNSSEYCASKFALRGLSQSLRAELAGKVDVLVVSPGSTDTEFFDNALELNAQPAWRNGSVMSPEKVAMATVRAIERGSHEIIPNFRGRMLTWLERFSPRLADHLVAKYAQ